MGLYLRFVTYPYGYVDEGANVAIYGDCVSNAVCVIYDHLAWFLTSASDYDNVDVSFSILRICWIYSWSESFGRYVSSDYFNAATGLSNVLRFDFFE